VEVTPDQLLAEIGRLHVANQVLTGQLAASRAQLVKQATANAEAEKPVGPSADADGES